MKRLILTLISAFCIIAGAYAQAWLEKLPKKKNTEEYTFYEYQKAFNDYWKPYNVNNKGYYFEKGIRKKASGWKQFNRWMWDMEGQIDPKTGKFPERTAQEVYNDFKKTSISKSSKAANWSVLGPNLSEGGYAGIGRINVVAFHPTDNNTYWVGAPAGGLWVTTNNGSAWTCLTDNNDVLGVSDIVIPSDYATSNTIYIATGDRDAWDNRSIGVLKSIDNGVTWNNTGLTATLAQSFMVFRLLLDPNDNNTIIAATSNGVFKTTNGGSTWSTQLTTHDFIDMEYKPGDFNTLYGSTESGSIYVSTNGGSTWSQAFYDANIGRIELAVTAANPAIVYAVGAGGDSGLYGVYKSTNSGTSFSQTLAGTTKNLLGWETDGSDSGGQGWYDLSLATSPTNENIVLVGGVNTWRSTNGGVSWSIVNHWYGGAGQAVHADKHMLKYRSNGDLFECNDGGVYISTNDGTGWTDKTNGMIISQMYKLGVSQTVVDEVVTGLQDNGSKLVSGGTWSDVYGGDGMECLIDYVDVNIQYATSQGGNLGRTKNHWASSTSITPPGAGAGAWVTPYIIDPVDHKTIYAGYADVWKSTNHGDSWTKISTMSSSDKLRSMAISESNNSVIVVADRSNIWKTTNGGGSWSNIKSNLPYTGSITYVAIKSNDENTIWVTLSGYNSDAVYESTNGGSSWVNISAGLPQLPAYTIVQNKQSTGSVQLYVGTELGVYFKDGSSNWVEFNTGLPNVKIGELEIHYNNTPASSVLYAATYGRGLWKTTVETPNNDLPSVITSGASNITQTSATVGGEILDAGTAAITERGVVWNLTGEPTLSDNTIVEGSTTVDAYTVSMTSLNLATTYYYRAYAKNSNGEAYGTTASFTTDCNAPADQASGLLAETVNENDITLTWTSGGDYVLVVAKEGSVVDVNPTSGQTYSANADFTNGEDIDGGNIVVYSGVGETLTVTNLMEATDYHFAVYKFNNSEKCYNIVSPATLNAKTEGYCAASGGGDEYISGVVFGDINNTGTGADGYTNYKHLSTDVMKGAVYTISISNGTEYTGDDLGIWIDFNNNKSFDDAGEKVVCAVNDGADGDYNISIPTNIEVGSYAMRIRIKYDGTDCGSPCGITSYGEVEDYTVNVVEGNTYAVNITVSNGSEIITGASVDLDSEEKTSDANGQVSYSKVSGSYNYSVTASGYQEKTGTIVVTDGNINETIILSEITSNNVVEDNLLKVFPNPTEGRLKLQGDVLLNSELSVIDLGGRIRSTKKSLGTEVELDLSNLSNGTYLIRITQGERVYKRYVIKK